MKRRITGKDFLTSKNTIITLVAFATLCGVSGNIAISFCVMLFPSVIVLLLSLTIYTPNLKKAIMTCYFFIFCLLAISLLLIMRGFDSERELHRESIVIGIYLFFVCIILIIDSGIRFNADFYLDDPYIHKKPHTKKQGESKRKAASTACDYPATQITAIAEELCRTLKAKGLATFLWGEFRCATRLKPDDLLNEEHTVKKLNLILSEIMHYLELPSIPELHIVFIEPNKSFYKSESVKAGQYTRNGYRRTITLNINRDYNIYTILAMLCHECTHSFMEYHFLNCNNTILNETRTDVVANLIGFNAAMILGYKEVSITEQEGSLERTRKHKVGYISDDDCLDLKLFLANARVRMKEQEERTIILARKKEQLGKNISAAFSLLEQLDNLDIKSNRSYSPLQIKEIQNVLVEIEGRDLQKEIEFCKAALNSSSVEQIERADIRIGSICTDMLRWLKALQAAQKSSPIFIYCKECGKRLNVNSNYCSNCGTKIW